MRQSEREAGGSNFSDEQTGRQANRTIKVHAGTPPPFLHNGRTVYLERTGFLVQGEITVQRIQPKPHTSFTSHNVMGGGGGGGGRG